MSAGGVRCLARQRRRVDEAARYPTRLLAGKHLPSARGGGRSERTAAERVLPGRARAREELVDELAGVADGWSAPAFPETLACPAFPVVAFLESCGGCSLMSSLVLDGREHPER